MRLVIDTNIVFSALIAGGKTRECIITAPVELYAPEFFYSEFENHRETILSKTNLDEDQLTTVFALLFENIELVPRTELADHIPKAREIMESIDPDDVPFLALAISHECDIWSDDDHFQEQYAVKVWESHELFRHLDLV